MSITTIPPHDLRLLRGVDVSRWQGAVAWERVAATGIDFAYVKVSEGASLVDPFGGRNLTEVRAAGLRAGAYHYLSASSSGEDQAAHFLSAYARDPGDLPPALDLETAGRGESGPALVARAVAWLAAVENALGVRPLVYTFPAFAASRLRCPEAARLAAYPLWVAHWRVEAPSFPAPWTDWAIWQHDNEGRVDGIHSKADLDCMRVPDDS